MPKAAFKRRSRSGSCYRGHYGVAGNFDFDDSASADYRTDAQLRKVLKQQFQQTTTVLPRSETARSSMPTKFWYWKTVKWNGYITKNY